MISLGDRGKCGASMEREMLSIHVESVAGRLYNRSDAETEIKRCTRLNERAKVRDVSVFKQAKMHEAAGKGVEDR